MCHLNGRVCTEIASTFRAMDLLKQDGIVAPPFGRRVGAEVTPAQAYEAARLATLAMLGSIRREVGDLDRISA